MLYYSTRGKSNPVTLTDAISLGLATDGGLFMPEKFPLINYNVLNEGLSYASFAKVVLEDFFKGDNLYPHLEDICINTFTFPLSIIKLEHNTQVLELFHGPTLSFKDFGAVFLAQCLNVVAKGKKITIMVATSGDTGSAVANAFYGKKDINVVVLYPNGQITKRQEQQISCYNDNVTALSVLGTFDDCQAIVKEAFADEFWQQKMHITSANSINLGRLLPQMTYYAYISYHYQLKNSIPANFIIPTGNLGNATSAYFAKKMGFPIDKIILATNANKVIVDYLLDGAFNPRASISTIANAMDVGNPSNFERLYNIYDNFDYFKNNVAAYSVEDSQIISTIKDIYQRLGKIVCPHTATALYVRNNCLANMDKKKNWIIAATAHPSKFETIIEPILGITLPIPQSLYDALAKPNLSIQAHPSLAEITNIFKSK